MSKDNVPTVNTVAESDTPMDGLVIYVDGSFRNGRAGWGLHAYPYSTLALTKGIGVKLLPTDKGYHQVEYNKTVTPQFYIDAFGMVEGRPTNNTAELTAAVEALELANRYDLPALYLRTDSTYVRDGLNKWLKNWKANGWLKKTGEPVENKELWQRLDALDQAWRKSDRKYTVDWVKAHNGEPGNDIADLNARTGSGGDTERYEVSNPAEGYHKPKTDANPLILKSRMLFNMGGTSEDDADDGHYYYLYQLGRYSSYGHKKEDTKIERQNKNDLLLGRRIAEATFCVLKTPEEDSYLESLKHYHESTHLRDIIELAVARLDVAYKPGIYQRLQKMGRPALIRQSVNTALVTPHDELVTKTQDPPRLARDAVAVFGILERQLNTHLKGERPDGITTVDITDSFFTQEASGKKGNSTKTILRRDITNNTPYIKVPVSLRQCDVNIRVVLGVDIPQRNPLAKLADVNTKVSLLIIANGPKCYSFATVFETDVGSAIYQSPYTQFLIP